MKKRLLYVGILFAISITHAQQDSLQVEKLDEIVISDSRFQLKRENSGKTIIKIDAKEIENSQGKTLSEIINTKSGIEINGSRSNGAQNLSTFIRGGNNRQVLVLIDGIQISDPSQIENDFDLRLLDINQIESIEIIKGAASTLYGNKASTAVINITSKKSSKEPISASFSSTIGTNQSSDDKTNNITDFTNHVSVNGTAKKVNYLASFAHQFTDGLSAVKNGTERDAFNRINVNTKIGYQISDQFSITVFGNHTKFKAHFDNTFPIEDADFLSKSEQNRIGFSSKYSYGNGSFNLNTSYNDIFREIESFFPNTFSGKSIVVDGFNKYIFNNSFYTILGVNYIQNKTDFINEEETNTIDPYANLVYVSDFGLNLNLGARFNNHSEYGSHLTYNLNPSFTYKFNDNYLKFLGSYSTSFIEPTLNKLFGFFGPNPNLEPEENTTIEAGFELKLNNNLRFNAIGFNRKEENFIDYVIIDPVTFEGQYQNSNQEFEVNGIEVELNCKIVKNLAFNANYTFTERKDIVSLRIPKHKANASLNYDINKKTFASISYQYIDDRLDTDFSIFENKTLDSFSLVDVFFSRQLIQNRLNMSISVSNILDEEYTEVIGFTTKGRNYKLGFKLNF